MKKTDPPKIDRKNDEKKEKREKKGKEDKEDDDDGEDGEMKPYSKEDVSSRNMYVITLSTDTSIGQYNVI